ncbi:MAG: M1 family aminopeptidase [Saprospiraceae bacterium]
MKQYFSLLLLCSILLMGCKSRTVTAPTVTVEERMLDTMFITADKPDNLKETEEFTLPRYNPSFTLRNNIVHTKLDLRFDWAKEHVLGKATLTVKPYFYPVDQLSLDAKGFDIHNITFADRSTPLKYEYDGQKIVVDLGKTIPSGQEYKVFIDYTAKPAEVAPGGGSAAITSDQGLFFINPRGEDPNKPQQIWTQGETEWNSRWFPTIDKPNERCTQETALTVQDKYKTLSNGTLVDSKKNSDGTRTDYYKMSLPHAPYLFMVAVGDFAVIKETWNGKPVEYFVEPEYEESARGIFSNTKEMLTFFSDKLGVSYPWEKYSQIIVRDYVSGAMENTTGVIFGEFIQKTNRELIDDHNELIIAHEMFHHWFGDYVTCESWANLTMNEGFANYSEYLWFEHKYGVDEAEQHRLNEKNNYVGSVAQGGAHPLIHFGYNDKEDMFDAHSYNKGGLVLHMLRNYMGDDAFFAGLKKYLVDNAYTAVEAHDLRLAMEEIAGEDLNWFFNQWYFASGHPEVKIDYNYDSERGFVEVLLEQTQNTDRFPAIFQLPISIDIYQGNQPRREYIVMDQRKQAFQFKVSSKPTLVNVDADRVLLWEKLDNKSEADYVFQFYNAPLFLDRYEAVEALKGSPESASQQVMIEALDDPFWAIRSTAMQYIDPSTASVAVKTKMGNLAKNDPHSKVRAAAFAFIGEAGDKANAPAMRKAIENQKEAYRVVASALGALAKVDEKEALTYAKKMESDDNGNVIQAVGNVYGMIPDKSNLAFFENNWDKMDAFAAFSFFDNYSSLVQSVDFDSADKSVDKLRVVAMDQDISQWKRFAATKGIFDLKEFYLEKAATGGRDPEVLKTRASALGEVIKEISAAETNGQLKMIYTNFK